VAWAGGVGGVLLPDGRVVLVPDRAAAVGLYDPATNTFALGPVGAAGVSKYRGGVLLPDGRVVLVPYTAAAVGLYDPATDTFAAGPVVGAASDVKYCGGVLLPDGRVVLVPRNAAAVGLYDPATNSSTPAYSVSRPLSPAMNALLLPYVNKL
jgi:streptogramin lyase